MDSNPTKSEDDQLPTTSSHLLSSHDSLNVRSRTSSIAMNYLHLDADKVLSAFGRFGRYQMLTYLITNSVHVLFAINMMVIPFITEDPKFNCAIPKNENWDYTVIDKCSVLDGNNWTIPCLSIPGASYNYSSSVSESLASEFDLVCDKYDSVEHGASVFLLGGIIVSPIITQLSDLFGRRITFLIPLYVAVLSNLICAFAPNYIIFLIFRFVAGVATSGFSSIGWVLCLESVSVEFRSLIPFMGNITWVAGYLLAGIFKLFINDWRYLYLAVSIPGLLTIPFYWLTPESIHWLITNKKNRGVRKYIQASSRYNRVTIPLHECKSKADLTAPEAPKRTVVDIFTNPGLLVNLLLNAYILVVMNGTYWALSLFSTELSENKMLGFFLSGLVELPAGIVATALIWFLPRKVVSFSALLLQALAMICVIYLPVPASIAIVFPLLAKCFNNIVWSAQPLLYTESTPTSVRNVFCGIATLLGEFGGVCAPYLKRLEAYHKQAPTMLIAGMSLVAAVFVLALPETKGKKLPEDLDDYDPGPVFRCWNNYNKSKEAGAPESTPMITVQPPSMEDNSKVTIEI